MSVARAFGAVGAVALALLSAGCPSKGPGAPPVAAGGPGRSTTPGLTVIESADHPPLALVIREGDPRPSLAVAIAHDSGSEASLALVDLLSVRLAARGFGDVQTRVHGLGVVVSTLVASPAEAARFVQSATHSLGTPLSASEPLAPPSTAKEPRARARVWRTRSETAVGVCSGELGIGKAAAAPDRGAVERWRKDAYSTKGVALGAVGPRAVLDAATAAHRGSPAWPTTGGPNDAWPAGDILAVEADTVTDRRLSIAYRISDPARASDAARTIGAPGATLSLRLGSLDSAFSVERVVATARARGACLRVDLRGPRGEPVPRPFDVARAIAIVDDEAERAFSSNGSDSWTLDLAVLRPGDPREASSVAAWRALAGRLEAGPRRRFVSYVARPAEAPPTATGELERALADLSRGWNKPTVERRARAEVGQGELWALVGSTCGTAGEGVDDAGASSLIVRSIAARRNASGGVAIDAWASPDGVGLVAHAPRASATESAGDHARRVGDALGRALVATRLTGAEIAEERADLIADLGPISERGFGLALETASGGHPSWLDPRGTFKSVTSLEAPVLGARRRMLLREPLRLAVIAPVSADQADKVGAALERWVHPHRLEPSACAASPKPAAKVGELSIEVARANETRAYLAIPIASDAHGVSRAAEATVFLLNRRGGWLDQALGALSSGATARSTVLGGKRASAILVELRNSEPDLAPAVAQVRALFERLARGAASEADAEAARRQFQKVDTDAMLDPRVRLRDLWTGASARPQVELAALRRFHQTLGPSAHLVVYEKPRE